MISRLVRTASAAAALAGLVLLLAPVSSGAADSTNVADQGWWNRANDESVPVTVPPPSNVGETDLYVAGTPEGATAVAALKLEIADGQTGPTLNLTVKDGQNVEGAKILACQTGSGWTGSQNGVWQAKPLIDCPSGSVTGIVAEDAGSVTFPLAPLQFADKMNIVLVAGADSALPDGLNGSAFQAVFEAPTAASITTSGGTQNTVPPSDDIDLGSFEPPPDSPGGDFSAPADSGGGDFSGSDTTTEPVAPPAAPAVGEDEQGQSATAPILQESTAGNALPTPEPVAVDRSGRPFAIILLLAATAGVIWDQQHKKRLALAGEDGEQLGGLGRFVRPREGAPPSLT